MNIIDPHQLLTPNQASLLHTESKKPFNLGPYTSLDDILTSLNVDVIIDPNTPSYNLPKDYKDELEESERYWRKKLREAQERGDRDEVHRIETVELPPIMNVLRCEGMALLGWYEHDSKPEVIKLFPNAMHSSNSRTMDQLLVSTFAHETMHAYFDRDALRKTYPYVMAVEEPLAEFGMLVFLDDTKSSFLNWAYNDVASKNTCYGLGANIFYQHQRGDTSWRKLLENYKIPIQVRARITSSGGIVVFNHRPPQIPKPVNTFEPFGGCHPNGNQIFYKTTDNQAIPVSYSKGNPIIYNDYYNFPGISFGVIEFDKPISCIYSSLFKNATKLSLVEYPDSVHAIGKSAFENCINLTCKISSNIHHVKENAFKGCGGTLILCSEVKEPLNGSGFDRIIFKDVKKVGPEVIGNTLKSSVKTIEMDDSVFIIDNSAFAGLKNLTNVKLSKNLKSIGERSFEGCGNLKEIDIPDSVVEIDCYSFTGCFGLKTIKIPRSVTRLYASTFIGCRNLQKILVPKDCYIKDWSSKQYHLTEKY